MDFKRHHKDHNQLTGNANTAGKSQIEKVHAADLANFLNMRSVVHMS